ncbi:ABC transporter ATP-binding protein [Spiribacter insolitus]|uniref:ABC transporter ATP-binding protein n=1 Tax=Spiribacter insolitus TaxID=3122417 RepID=A0ABV3T6N9_9GAMM
MSINIRIAGVSHWFASPEDPVLDGVNLNLDAGQTLSIVGESGCGKSTLLHMIAGMLQPRTGRVYVGGQPALAPNPRWNIMFQRSALYPWLTVVKNVALGLEFAGIRKGRRARALAMLERVGLADRADAHPQDLSGGQQQRVALARSLVVSPSVILLDEPFSALDTFTRSDLQAEVLSIVAEQGITLVQVTHDLDEAVIMGDRIAVMERHPGRIHGVIENRMPAPRQPGRPGFAEMRDELLAAFGRARRNPLSTDTRPSQAPVAVNA